VSGTLWLIPVTLGGDDAASVIPAAVLERARRLSYFIAEEPKTARAFLKSIGHPEPLASLRIEKLDHNTSADALPALLDPLIAGGDAGLLSEAGCPALADPGAGLVRLAHDAGVRVAPLSGPSSIVLALMGSGLETQRFSFHGYLPVKDPDRQRALQSLERRSRQERETQIFIEAPYRNDALVKAIVAACSPNTLLCLATDLTLATESIGTRSVVRWKAALPSIDRRPTVFLLLAQQLSAAAARS
jgi:16S rRNA (cytidine1402-2'-O)-methyltransferase